MEGGVYQIQSKIKPKRVYIGSAVSFKNRWRNHLKDLRNKRHGNGRLQNHFNKYGESDLHFSILLGCEKDDLIKIEQYFLDFYKPYFNICLTAGSSLGRILSEETKHKISVANTGKKHPPMSEERKNKLRIKRSLETRLRLSIARRKQKPRTGWHWSKEERKKMSMARIGDKNPFFGKHHKPEVVEMLRQRTIKMNNERRNKVDFTGTELQKMA